MLMDRRPEGEEKGSINKGAQSFHHPMQKIHPENQYKQRFQWTSLPVLGTELAVLLMLYWQGSGMCIVIVVGKISKDWERILLKQWLRWLGAEIGKGDRQAGKCFHWLGTKGTQDSGKSLEALKGEANDRLFWIYNIINCKLVFGGPGLGLWCPETYLVAPVT